MKKHLRIKIWILLFWEEKKKKRIPKRIPILAWEGGFLLVIAGGSVRGIADGKEEKRPEVIQE